MEMEIAIGQGSVSVLVWVGWFPGERAVATFSLSLSLVGLRAAACSNRYSLSPSLPLIRLIFSLYTFFFLK